MKKQYIKENWQINSYIGVDVYAKESELRLKAEKLFNLIKLGIENEIVCLSTFKERYILLEKAYCSFEGQGFYQILGDNKEVFCIKSLK